MSNGKGAAAEAANFSLLSYSAGGVGSIVSHVKSAGYAVVGDVDQAGVGQLLAGFGELMPQYDGAVTYEVKAEPGFEDRRYSKSQNEIRAHTEAPGWSPPPMYLALWCRVPAEGSGGETCLADVREYLTGLPQETVARLRSQEIKWGGTNTGGRGSSGVAAPLLGGGAEADLLRFSYNLLTSGEYDPPVEVETPTHRLPLAAFGRDLAHGVHEFFINSCLRIRIPEGAVLVWDNQRMAHARTSYTDSRRHLTRFWIGGF